MSGLLSGVWRYWGARSLGAQALAAGYWGH